MRNVGRRAPIHEATMTKFAITTGMGRRRALGVGLALVVAVGGEALAQSNDFKVPQVVLETGGHQGPPRSILFTPDGRQMISGGFDKVIRVWNLDDGRPRPARTIRPPIWRGPAGTIYALALAPRPIPGEKDQRYLAVGGYGVSASQGNILIYRFPGSVERPNGDILFQLPRLVEGEDAPPGHTNTAMSLAFSPDGSKLASAGMDGKILIWDLATRAIVRTIQPSDAPVNAIAYAPDGASLVSGSADGLLCVWDPATGALRHKAAPPREPGAFVDAAGDSILTLAVVPVAPGWILVGRENATLWRYTSDLSRRVLLPKAGSPGPVEALAVSPDGQWLATSVVAERLKDLGDVPTVACAIQLRRLPDGEIVGPDARSDNLVYALAFSPDGRFLAHGGGDAQELVVRDRKAPELPTVALRGVGRSVWGVGWTKDSRAVTYARQRADLAAGPVEIEGFHLFDRRLIDPEPGDVSGPVTSWNGYQLKRIGVLDLAIVDPRGREIPIHLDPNRERRWWSWSFIPPGNGHEKPMLAVGCEAGVLFFDLGTGRRFRHYAGHFGPVYAIAPSPDGRWLASGSSDQTVRIWPLAGCDQPAALGMTIERRADGSWRVASVDRLGFADRDMMQLEVDDVIERAGIGRKEWPADQFADFLARADAAPPNTTIMMIVRRGAERLPVNTTKRDSPVLSLFVGVDREWVVWMPQGYYETSVAGDRKYLLWHRNGSNADQPTDIFPADRFERELRLPNVLNTLLTTGDLALALAAVPVPARQPEQLVAAGAPPIVEIAGPPGRLPDQPFASNDGTITITPTVSASDGRSPISSVRVLVEGRTGAAAGGIVAPVAQFNGPLTVQVPPGRHRVSVVATNAQGRERVEGFDVEVPEPARPTSRLAVLSIGVKGPFPREDLPAIQFADLDAQDVARRLGGVGGKVFDTVLDYRPITNGEATASVIQEALRKIVDDGLGPNDSLMVMLESHFVTSGDRAYFVGNNAVLSDPAGDAIAADALADLLANVAQDGARVILLVDAVHPKAPAAWDRGFRNWVRGLSRRGVVTFVASNSGPSLRHRTQQHGAFAAGVIGAPTARGQFRAWADPASAFTLDDFRETVIRLVEDMTRRRQHAACYIPETISPQVRLFAPGREEAEPGREAER
jgi:WD40 repeat protein